MFKSLHLPKEQPADIGQELSGTSRNPRCCGSVHCPPALPAAVRIGAGLSGAGCDLFFALSDFVLAHAYDDRLRHGMTPLAFLRQRWARLYPIYDVGFLLGVVHATLCIKYNSPAEHLSWEGLFIAIPFAAFMLLSPAVQGMSPLNGPMWSIFFELLANLLRVIFWRPLQSVKIHFGMVLACGGLYVCVLMYVEAPALGLTGKPFPGGWRGCVIPSVRACWSIV